MTDTKQRLTEWLDLMLGEIARKRDDARAARAEQDRRNPERHPGAAHPDR